jgi:hypothetical protein
MTLTVNILSASNLCRNPTDIKVCPQVSVLAFGPTSFNLGQTPASVFHHPETQNPLWNTALPVNWFRASQIEFVIKHYRPIISDENLSRVRIPLSTVAIGQPLTICLPFDPPLPEPATLTVQFDLAFAPLRPILSTWRHSRLYVYATYSPPITTFEGPFPVSFKCLNVCDIEQRFSIFDEHTHWQSIGKGSHGFLSLGPTGLTPVVYLNRGKCDKSTSVFLVCTGNYQGIVTLNFVLGESGRTARPYRKLPRRESIGFLFQSSVTVAPQSVTTIPHRLRIEGWKYGVDDFPLQVLTPGGDILAYERTVANSANPAIVFGRRVVLPTTCPFSIHDMCQLTGLGLPNQVAVCGCWRPIVEHHGQTTAVYHPKLITMAFDHDGRFVTAVGVDWRPFDILFPESALDGKMKDVARGKFDKDIGLLRVPYYQGQRTLEFDLHALPMGVCSIAFALLSPSRHRMCMYKRMALRIVNLENGDELGVAHVHAESRSEKWGVLIGGLAYAHDLWQWVPSGAMVRFGGPLGVVGMASPIWYQRLVEFGLIGGY